MRRRPKFTTAFATFLLLAVCGYGYYAVNFPEMHELKFGEDDDLDDDDSQDIQPLAVEAIPPIKKQFRRKNSHSQNVEPTISLVLGDHKPDEFPGTISGTCGETEFNTTFTGKFIRLRKIVLVNVEIYQLACYLESPKPAPAEQILDGMLEDVGRKIYVIRFTRALSGGTILKTIKERIDETFTDVDMKHVGKDLNQFIALFENGTAKSDAIYLSWQPGSRLYGSYNDPKQLKLITTDLKLTRAIWRIWCGNYAGEHRKDLVERFAIPKIEKTPAK